MLSSKEILKKFDLYPFATLATDASGSIVYKNLITKSIYPNIHIGAKLSVYTDIDNGTAGVVRSVFYGEEISLLIHKFDTDGIQNIIAVFSPACAHLVFTDDAHEGYEAVIKNLMEKEDGHDGYKQKHALIRHVSKSLDLARACGRFARLYLDNCDFNKCECVSVASFFKSLSNIMERRLTLDIKLNIDSYDSGINISIDKQSSMVLLNLVCFSVSVSDDRELNVSFEENGGYIRISIKSKCTYDMSKIFDAENELPYIFTLLVGMNLAICSEYDYSFSHNGKETMLKITVPRTKASEIAFSSIGVSERFINEYFSLLTSIFKN